MRASLLGIDDSTLAAAPAATLATSPGGGVNTGDAAADREPSQPLLVSAEGLAKLLEVSKRSLWRLRSAGRLPRPVKLGGTIRWRVDEVRAWIAAGCPSLEEWDASCGRGR